MHFRLKHILVSIFILINCHSGNASGFLYAKAFSEIESMLSGKDSLDFKKAVFITENAYFDNRLNNDAFDEIIRGYASFCKEIMNSGDIIYTETDKDIAGAQCAVFVFMTDTIPLLVDNAVTGHYPFTYNYDDFAGQKDWSSMFVTTLMQTKKGNCHSLPFLYKLIMDEMGYESYLALAPNHMYIKARNKRAGWYNIELTCGDFPTDAWLTASGYVHLDAVRNGIYMNPLSDKQSVALCMVDLAQGYRAKHGTEDGSFILRCCDAALRYFPNYINALLLKAETLTALYRQSAPESKEAEELLMQMNEIYPQIHRSGYRKMPEDMYMSWLVSLSILDVTHEMKSLLINKESR